MDLLSSSYASGRLSDGEICESERTGPGPGNLSGNKYLELQLKDYKWMRDSGVNALLKA